jgi:hypothetical protein
MVKITIREAKLSGAKSLPPDFEDKRIEWVELIQKMDNRYGFDKSKLRQKSPSFEYQNWRCNIEHAAEFKSVVLMWLGQDANCPKPHPYWVGVSLSDTKQGWKYRRKIEPKDFPELLAELQER